MRLPVGPTAALLIVLAIGMLMRVGFSTYRHAADPDSRQISRETTGADDQLDYDTTARSILAGRGFWSSDQGGSRYFSEPAYPVFLAGLYATGLDSVLAVRIVQAFLGVLSCFLLYRIGAQILHPWAGVAAALMLAVNPSHVFYSAYVLSETLRVFAVVAMLTVVIEALKRRTPRWIAAAGLAAGVVTMARVVLIPYLGILAVLLAVVSARSLPQRTVYAALVLSLGFLALIPWSYRNYTLTGTFSTVRPDAAELLAGSTDPASAARLAHDPEYKATRDQRFSEETLRAREELAGAGVVAGASGVMELTWQRLRTDPVGLFSLYARRAIALWQLQPGQGAFAMPLVQVYCAVVNGLTFLLCGVGLFLSRMSRPAFLALLFLILVVTGVHLLFETAPVRYRMPADPAVVLVAAAGLTALVDRARGAIAPTPVLEGR
jgi:4-amino-4-deoxy-L-arabinose transferase-like glycosyltransferase